MLLYALLHGRELHVVVEEMAQILVVVLGEQHRGVLERELLAAAEPCLGEYLAVAV